MYSDGEVRLKSDSKDLLAKYWAQGISIIVSALFFTQFGCKDKSVDSPPPGSRNPREYSWTVDTLKYGLQIATYDIFGISPKNVYSVGHCDFDGGIMWHFDGNQWSNVQLDPSLGFIDLGSVYAFAPSTVFAVGERLVSNQNPLPNFLDSSLAFVFDGSQWRSYKLSAKGLHAVWGSSPNNVWAVGRDGAAFLFDGIQWAPKRIRDDISFTALSGSSSSDVYALGYKLDNQPYDSIAVYVFHFDGSAWTLRDSLLENTFPPTHSFGISDVWALNSTEVYSVGYGVYKKAGVSWQKIFDDGSLFGGIRGSASDNVFAVGYGIYHYNGKDWFHYNQFQNQIIPIVSIWADGSEVFAVGTDGSISYVFHGK